jgi:hypothetical protein
MGRSCFWLPSGINLLNIKVCPTAQRLVVMVLENRGGGNYYPVTAYYASHEDKVLHERLRGGEKDETEK